MWSQVKVFAAAVALVLTAQSAHAFGPYAVINPKLACPNCDLNAPGRAICESGLTTDVIPADTKICVELLPNETYCDNKRRLINPNPITNLTNNALHCGECGKQCAFDSDTPACINGVCGCDETTRCLDRTKRCDLETKKCTKPCGEGLVTCGSEICGTNVLNTTTSCGACGNQCGTGHTCENGQCACGDFKSRCPYPASTCLNGKCVECISATDNDGSFCAKRSIFDESRFCNSTSLLVGGFCDKCPADFADCTDSNLDGLPDTGAPSDCETKVNVTRQTATCGTCNGRCTSHAGQMCCSGECKCGTFTNLTDPSAGECAAAQTCSTSEYCDAKLKRCVALDPSLVNCQASAASPIDAENLFDSGSALSELPYCGSCNRAEGLKNIINGTCMNSNSRCGGEQKVCRSGQVCSAAKCVCATSTSTAFTWNKYIDEDPDGDNKFDALNRPASGCNAGLVGSVLAASFVRTQLIVLKLQACGEISGVVPSVIKSITPADLKNDTYLAQLCPPMGGEGLCPPGFCKDAVRNLTGQDRGDFCGAAFDYANINKYCTQEYRASNNRDGDLTCATLLAQQTSGSGPTTVSWLEMFTFLGCDKPREDFIWHFNPSDRGDAFMYRGEVARILLAGAPASAAIGFGALLALAFGSLLAL